MKREFSWKSFSLISHFYDTQQLFSKNSNLCETYYDKLECVIIYNNIHWSFTHALQISTNKLQQKKKQKEYKIHLQFHLHNNFYAIHKTYTNEETVVAVAQIILKNLNSIIFSIILLPTLNLWHYASMLCNNFRFFECAWSINMKNEIQRKGKNTVFHILYSEMCLCTFAISWFFVKLFYLKMFCMCTLFYIKAECGNLLIKCWGFYFTNDNHLKNTDFFCFILCSKTVFWFEQCLYSRYAVNF